VAIAVAYPLAVYFLLDRGALRLAGLVLLAVVTLRLLLPGGAGVQGLAILALGGAFAAGIAVTASEALARLYPVAVSAALLAAFGATLRWPPSMVECIARASGAELDAGGVRYTHNVTVAWCAFFLFNGGVALATALYGSREAWALYNGLVSYVLAGALYVGERLIRPMRQRRVGRAGMG
jgi:uncharacterized membrane protein